MGQERKFVAKFDANKDGWLNSEERKLARAAAKAEPARGPGGRGGPGGFGRRRGPGGPARGRSRADHRGAATGSQPGADA